MLWPLDEEAVYPSYCALWTGGRHTEDEIQLLPLLIQRPACVCCVGEAVLACAKGRLVSTCTPERRASRWGGGALDRTQRKVSGLSQRDEWEASGLVCARSMQHRGRRSD
jgi:hypothetical protein